MNRLLGLDGRSGSIEHTGEDRSSQVGAKGNDESEDGVHITVPAEANGKKTLEEARPASTLHSSTVSGDAVSVSTSMGDQLDHGSPGDEPPSDKAPIDKESNDKTPMDKGSKKSSGKESPEDRSSEEDRLSEWELDSLESHALRRRTDAARRLDLGAPGEDGLLQLDCKESGDDERYQGCLFSCNGVVSMMRYAAQEPTYLVQRPERGDGIGARLLARIQVMAVAFAMGFHYVHSPIEGTVPVFGPTIGGQHWIDWENVLNLKHGFQLWDQVQGKKRVQFKPMDILALLEGYAVKEGESGRAFMLEHGSTFADSKCMHPLLTSAYKRVTRALNEAYEAGPREVENLKRPKCGYSSNIVDVALHLRRGDVQPGDPETMTRCGKPVYSAEARKRNHELRRPFFTKNWAKRGNSFPFYIRLMDQIYTSAKSIGLDVRFHIYSQTSVKGCPTAAHEDFPRLKFEKSKYNTPAIDTWAVLQRDTSKGKTAHRAHVVLNNDPEKAFHCLQSADVLVVAKSTFSIAAGVIAKPSQVRIYPPQSGGWQHRKAGGHWISADEEGNVDPEILYNSLKENVAKMPDGLGLELEDEDVQFDVQRLRGRGGSGPEVTIYQNFSKVNYWTAPSGEHNSAHCTTDFGHFRYLGRTATAAECQRKCLEYDANGLADQEGAGKRGGERCWSYTWFPKKHYRFESAVHDIMWLTENRRCPMQCFAVTAPHASLDYNPGAVSGDVHWPCRSNEDCSMNGKCDTGSGRCQCRRVWTGDRCQTLRIGKPRRHSGYQMNRPMRVFPRKKFDRRANEFRYAEPGADSGELVRDAASGNVKAAHSSSWGGTVVRDKNGKYHMWVSEITDHCGIVAWGWNSQVVHATADDAQGPYQFESVVWPVFAHEPRVVPLRNGSLVMFFTADLDRDTARRCVCCHRSRCDGSTKQGDCPFKRVDPVEGAIDEVERSSKTYASIAQSPEGPWSKPFEVGHGDANISPIIFANDTSVVLARKWGLFNWYGSHMVMQVSQHWSRMTETRTDYNDDIFKDFGSAGVEDPFVYEDQDGVVHAIFHHMWGSGSWNRWWSRTTGGHAYMRVRSMRDSKGHHQIKREWVYTGVAWGNETAVSHSSRPMRLQFKDGSEQHFTRFERPHFVFSGTLHHGMPTHLSVAVQTGKGIGSTIESSQHAKLLDDASHTLVIPLGDED